MNTITCSIWDSDPGRSLTPARAFCMDSGSVLTAPAAPTAPKLVPINRRRDIDVTAQLHSLGRPGGGENWNDRVSSLAARANARLLARRKLGVTQLNSQ